MLRVRSVITVLVLLALSASPAAAAQPSAADSARAEHQRIVRYWTAERLNSAVPRNFLRTPSGFVPAAKPPDAGKPGGGGGGGGGGSTTVSGASWTKGGAIKQRAGKVFFRLGSTNYVCSGAVVTDSRSSYSLVLTAAHCAYDEVAKAFATNWMFIPEYVSSPTTNCSNTAHGCWTAAALVVHKGYADAGGFNTQATVHDFAFAVVGAGSNGAQLDTKVGSFGISYSGVGSGDRLYAFGYPAAGKYKGRDLVYCAGPIFEDPYNDKKTWGMTCDMTGGSSGGPWLSSFSETTGSGTLSSVNSYGYSGVKAMHGPKFNSTTQAVFNAANSATTNTIVP